ncbi:MAG: glycosyltransferase family 2 protein [Cellvibrionales bacterium]|nr:glycosyltransferase family 2 protein [Cellvibrionales bacterium]
MNDPHFFIVTPTYNRSHLIRRTIQSVLDQDYKHYSLYLCDDGSKDDTLSVIQSYSSHPNVSVLSMGVNSGVNKTRNKMLDVIQAEKKNGFIILLDDDDFLTPTALQDLVNIIHKHPLEQWIVTGCVTPDGKPITVFNQTGSACCVAKEKGKKAAVERDATHCMHINLVGDIRFTEQFKNGEEWFFFVKLAKKSKMYVVDILTKIVEYQEQGLSHQKYNLEHKASVHRLKVDTMAGFVSEDRLNKEKLLLARELIKLLDWAAAKQTLSDIPYSHRFSLRFIRYRLKVLFHA